MPSLIGNEFSCRFPLCFPVAGLQGPWALPPLIGRANPFLGAHIIIGQQTVHSLELWMLQKNVATFQCVGGPPFFWGAIFNALGARFCNCTPQIRRFKCFHISALSLLSAAGLTQFVVGLA